MAGFDVFLNSLTGPLPDYFSAWPALVLFDVENNTLTGEPLALLAEPSDTRMLEDLRFFRLSFNLFSGSLSPAATRQLAGIEQLWIAGNNFGGTLPTEIGLMTSLGTECTHRNDSLVARQISNLTLFVICRGSISVQQQLCW